MFYLGEISYYIIFCKDKARDAFTSHSTIYHLSTFWAFTNQILCSRFSNKST